MTDQQRYTQFLDSADIKYTVLDHAESDVVWITVEDDQPIVGWNGYSGFVVQAVFDKDGKLNSFGAAE